MQRSSIASPPPSARRSGPTCWAWGSGPGVDKMGGSRIGCGHLQRIRARSGHLDGVWTASLRRDGGCSGRLGLFAGSKEGRRGRGTGIPGNGEAWPASAGSVSPAILPSRVVSGWRRPRVARGPGGRLQRPPRRLRALAADRPVCHRRSLGDHWAGGWAP